MPKTSSKRISIRLDPKQRVTLGRQLYDRLKEMILSGDLQPGDRLLSTRELADQVGVSRPTVEGSYEQLLQEGYLESKRGSGTFVSSSLPQQSWITGTASDSQSRIQKRLSLLGHRLVASDPLQPGVDDVDIAFYSWRPSVSDQQVEEWARLWWRTARIADRAALDFQSDPLGYRPLRQAIASDLLEKRSLQCEADQVIIVDSLPQALDLIARLHIDRGDRAAIEDPGYPQFREIASLHGAEVTPVPVDENGMIVDELFASSASGLKLLYVTPSHQCPTGAVMSLPRRLALLEWAHANGVVIIEDEDDFETDNCYGDRPLSALMGLDRSQSVIYIGSFSKIVSPFVAMTYLVVPPGLSGLYARARRLMGAQLPNAAQHCLKEFIEQGRLRAQVRRMRDVYESRRQALLKSLQKHFAGRITLGSMNAGLYVLATFKTKMSADEIIAKAHAQGVGILSTAPFYAGRPKRGEFILGFGDLDERQIHEGVRRLAKVIV